MASGQTQICRVRLQLVACNGTTDLWADLSKFYPTTGIGTVRGRIVLCDKSGTFRARVGIQTFGTDAEVPDPPTAIGTGLGNAYVTAVVKQFVDFDPTAAGNGVIATKAGMRVGLLYSSTDGTVSRGDVILELFVDV